MTDKELITLAAKAAGIEWNKAYKAHLNENGAHWLPLTDDGDAFRLAVKLKFDIRFGYDWGAPVVNVNSYRVTLRDDPYAATRQAIVRAAAEIGRTL